MKLNYFILIIFSVFLLSSVFAVGWPHQFYGQVTINDNPANNATISAQIDGVEFGSINSIDGTYGFTPDLFFVSDPDGVNQGETIEFFVNATKVAESTFMNNGLTELNLALTIDPFCGDGVCNGSENSSSCAADCPAPADTGSPSGGSSGGGGGGGGGGGLGVTISNKCINSNALVEVKLSNKKPASNTTVVVFKENKSLISGTTDINGIFDFNLTEAIEYKLEVYKPGYLKVKKDFSLVDCSVEEPKEDETSEETLGTGTDNLCLDVDCNDGNPCTIDSCSEGVCNYNNQLDGTSCGEDSVCNAGECISTITEETKDNAPPVVPSTGFFGLNNIQGTLAVVVVIAAILGIGFFALKGK